MTTDIDNGATQEPSPSSTSPLALDNIERADNFGGPLLSPGEAKDVVQEAPGDALTDLVKSMNNAVDMLETLFPPELCAVHKQSAEYSGMLHRVIVGMMTLATEIRSIKSKLSAP